MNFHRIIGTLALLTSLWCAALPAGAEELFVKNRRFEGLAIRAGEHLWVELEPLCTALGVPFKRSPAGGYILRNSSSDSVPKYSVKVGDVIIRGDQVQGKLLVPLKELASQIQARVVYNKTIDTIDVSL